MSQSKGMLPSHLHTKSSSLHHGSTCRQEAYAEAGSDFPDKHCEDPYCRRGLFCSFVCKFCSKDFCSDHFRAEDHKCEAGKEQGGDWVHPSDKRATTCTDCGVVVSEASTLAQFSADNSLRRNYEENSSRIRSVKEEMLAAVRSQLHQHAEKRANLHSFWSTMDSLDESDIIGEELKKKYSDLQEEKSSLLLGLHLLSGACAGKRAKPQAAPSLKCSMKKCKNKGFMIQHCKKCKASFCISHRLPEVHSCK